MKRSEIYTAIRDEAAAKLAPKWIDLQKGQMRQQKENYPFPFPALLIEIGDFNFSQMAEYTQKGVGLVSLYLIKSNLTDTFKGAKKEELAIELLNSFDSLFQTFEGFTIGEMTPLVRVKEYKPEYGNKYIMFRADFSTSLDDAKQVTKQKAKPKPDIAAKFKF